MHWLVEADKSVFLFFNGLHNHFFDILMAWISNKFTWFPFYAVLIIWLIVKYKLKGLILVLMIVLVIILCDQVTSSFMKPFFARLRPCHDPEIESRVHVVGSCGGLYGFASSHAANAFGLVMFLYLIFRKIIRNTAYLFIWAFMIAYSRVYVGVHFTGDVAAGALTGCLFAFLIYALYLKFPDRHKIEPEVY